MMRTLAIVARVSQVVLRCAAIAFLGYLAFVLWPLRAAVQESQKTIHAAGEVVHGVQEQIAPTAHSVGIILKGAAVTSDEVARASVAQKQYWSTVSEHTIDAIGDAQDAIKKWGSVGSATQEQIAPTFTRFQTTLDRTNALLATTEDQVQKTGPLLLSATSFVDHADGLIADPATRGSLINLQRFSGAAAGLTEDTQKPLEAGIGAPSSGWIGCRKSGRVWLLYGCVVTEVDIIRLRGWVC
jgi:hypothetical protein